MRKYRVKTSKHNLYALNHFNIKHVRIIEDNLVFFTDEKSLEKMKIKVDLEYEDLAKKKLKEVLRKHLITIIGALLIIMALINQSQSIVDVRFTNKDTYDEEVVEHLEKYYKRVGPFKYLTTNLNEINLDLRSTFYQYEWIGLRKEGAYLYLDIKRMVNPPIVEEKTPGSYYARKDGIVKMYHLEKGVVVVQEEQFVHKGDLLISGEIIHYNNKLELIRAKGFVIAEVLEYKDYTISKEIIEIIRSGKMKSQTQIFLFGKHINKEKIPFENYEIEEVSLKKFLGNLFVIRKVNIYEIKEVRNVYNEEEATQYALSHVYRDFRAEKTNEFEKIIYNNLVKIEEDENYFYVRLIVKSHLNIAKFIPFPEA